MADDEARATTDPEQPAPGAAAAADARSTDGRDPGRALIALVAVVALLFAAGLVPAVGAPLSDGVGPDGPTAEEGGDGASPGALTPGARAGVGQPTGDDAGPGGVDGLRNLSERVHFVVEAERASYWRTGAYATYTGDGWRRASGRRAYDPPVVDARGPRLRQQVTVNVSATALPAAWRPVRADAPDGRTLQVTSGDALRVHGGVDPGTTLRVVSRLQDAAAGDLRAAGRDYPAGVERYTQLPETTPDRLGAFTDDLTATADSPYETARTVELWLERNKTYSLNASHDPEGPVASQFVFEMERGYCEYFATAMVAMLRTQDIPARYVVGYAPGRAAGEDRYEVRALDAHAWVEVYFPDHGWVRFDPTPAAARRAAEREAIGAGGDGTDRRPPVEGSPGDEADADDLPTERIGPEVVPPPPYDVRLNATPVPGRPVTATVTKDGRPVEGVVVTVDGVAAGRTDRNGAVRLTVPYEESVVIDARPPADAETDTVGTETSVTPAPVDALAQLPSRPVAVASVGRAATATVAGVPRTGLVRGVGGRETLAGVQAGTGTDDGDQSGDESAVPRKYDVRTDASLSVVEGVFAPGRRATLRATVDGVPLRDVDVVLAGATVGRTDAQGRVSVAVPSDLRGTAAVDLRRGAVAESVSLDLATLDVSLRSSVFVVLPGVDGTARVTVGDRPVQGARVYVDGDPAGVTGADGTVDLSVPASDAVRVRATGPVMTATTLVDGLYLRLVGVLGLGLAVVAGGAAALTRRAPGALPAGVQAAARRRLGWLWRVVIDERPGAVGEICRRLALAAGGGLYALLTRAVRLVARGGALVGALVTSPLGTLRRAFGGSRGARDSRDETARDATTPEDPTGSLTVRAAWRLYVALLPVSRDEARTMTPDELAARGVEAGLPRRAVEGLRDAYRDVVYGDRDPERRRRDAAEAIERVHDTDGDREPRPGRDGGEGR